MLTRLSLTSTTSTASRSLSRVMKCRLGCEFAKKIIMCKSTLCTSVSGNILTFQLISYFRIYFRTATLICAIFLGATAYAYAASEKRSTVSGRSFLMFTLSLLFLCVTNSLLNFESSFVRVKADILVSAGILFTFLWINVLAFDIFWAFKNFRKPSETLKRFKFYCLYVICAPLLYILFVLLMNKLGHNKIDFFNVLTATAILGSAALDFIFILLTGYMILKISKTSNVFEQALFVAERDR